MRPMHAEHSPDESIAAGQNAHVNSVRLTMPRDPWQWITATFMALCFLALIAVYLAYRYDAQERDLDRYDDGRRQERIDKELADLRSQVGTLDKLIQAYGLQNSVKNELKRK